MKSRTKVPSLGKTSASILSQFAPSYCIPLHKMSCRIALYVYYVILDFKWLTD